jgi:UDP:flavonoid glycosyltransferase YjiC (YdhE family)
MRLVARALMDRGHEVVMSLRDVVEPAAFLKDETYPIIQGPHWSRPAPKNARGQPFAAATFSDILAVGGFSDADALTAMLRAWDSLIDVVRPDLVVAEYAPLLALAAHGRVPAVLFGSGFTVPPADLPVYPRLQPRIEPVATQQQILAVVREAQKRRGRPAPETLPAVLACEARFPCTFPELDPYRAVRREPTIPPLTDLPPPLAPARAPRFFAYLAADAGGLPKLLSALAKSGVPGGIFLRSPPQKLRDAIRKTAIALYDEPQPLARVLAEATLVIHHGGAGTSEAALAAGRPQIIFSRHLEQAMTARALNALGVGANLSRDAGEEAVVDLIRRAAADKPAAARAAARAADIAARGPRPGVAPIVDACEQLLAAPSGAGSPVLTEDASLK